MNTTKIELTEQEANLIEMLRRIGFGEVTVIVRKGQPVRAEEILRSIDLSKP